MERDALPDAACANFRQAAIGARQKKWPPMKVTIFLKR
jgi:hypothetical protein